MKILPPAPPYVGPPRWHGGSGNKPIDLLVVHGTAGAEPGVPGAARATASYSKATSRPSSWHYCRDSRECVQLTYDSVIAYHCGGRNVRTIGYEFCCSLSAKGLGHWRRKDHQAMLREGAKDFARLCLAYNIPIRRVKAAGLKRGERGITDHNQVRLAYPGTTSHWDPGPFFPWRKFMRMVQAAADELTGADPRPEPAPAPTPECPSLEVGWWNMRRDRDKNAAARAALAIMDEEGLDVLALQETADYIHQLRQLPGVQCVAFDGKPGQADTAILVRDGHTLSETGIEKMTPTGWITVRGGHTPPKWMPHVLVDGWLRVGSIHTAPSVTFDRDDTPEGPVRRVASTIAHARSEVAFVKAHPGPLVIPGDRNATPDDRGRYSPWWISRQTGMQLAAPTTPTHGGGKRGKVIDFALTQDVTATGTATTQKRHGSDHAPGHTTITKETPR